MGIKVVLIPGNGGGSPKTDNWFPSLKKDLEKEGIEVVAEEFPDNILARASIWLPFLKNDLNVDDETILVGHSSGAIAALKLAETTPILGSVLVGAYHTHLKMKEEILSEYFDTPWLWDKIRSNQKWTAIFASQDDPWIPIEEARYLHRQLNCEYHEYKDEGHFGGDYHKPEFPELTYCILRNIKKHTIKTET